MKKNITIDDVGMSPAVNSAADILLRKGVVNRLSILATGSELPGAIDLASKSDVAVSVHLNCVQPPFLTEEEFPSSHFDWFRKGLKLSNRVRIEWKCQIEKVLSAGLVVTGLDSHQHIHNAGGLREVILELAHEYGIGTVRAAVIPERWKNFTCFMLDRLGRKLSKSASRQGIATPQWMLGFSRSGNVTRDYLENINKSLKGDGFAELVMHPATEPVWTPTQTDELKLMQSEWITEWLTEN